MAMEQPEPGVIRAEPDDDIATGRNDDDVTHGWVDEIQGWFAAITPCRLRAQPVGAIYVVVWADVTSGGAVEGRVAHGQHSEVVPVHMDRVVLEVVRVYRVVVDEHHLYGFVVGQVEYVRAMAAVSIAHLVVARHDVIL